ncbi:MAG: TolC family protein [Akkermansiaceae bacterium]|nr:TolC family protein [Akkermansiaceae bacterium]
MKSTFCILVGLLVPIGPLLANEDATLLTNDLLSRLRSEAAAQHPAVDSSRLKAIAAYQDIRSVRLWNDPTVGLSLMGADTAKRKDDGDVRLSFEQPLPVPGLYEANRAKAEAIGRAEVQKTRVSALSLGSSTAKSAIELALADEAIRLQTSQIIWLKKTVENAHERALNPGETGIDSLRLESQLVRDEQTLDAAKRTRDSLAQRLNLNLGRPLESPWAAMSLPAQPVPVPVANAEIARISRTNPQILAMQEMANAAAAETRIADRERQPGFAVGVETDLYSGGDFRSTTVGVRMTLPWFNEPANQAKVDASRSREQAAGKDTQAAFRDIAAGVLSAVSDAANAGAQARAYSGEVYNKANTANTTLEDSWITSKSPLTDLLESNRLLFSIRLEQRRYIAMQLAALEDLYVLVPNRQ